MHRVVVTGLGAVTPLGHDAASYWTGLKRGQDGIRPVESIPPEKFNQKVLGEVKGFDPLNFVGYLTESLMIAYTGDLEAGRGWSRRGRSFAGLRSTIQYAYGAADRLNLAGTLNADSELQRGPSTRAGEPVYGMMHQPFTRERFTGDSNAACLRKRAGSCRALRSAVLQ